MIYSVGPFLWSSNESRPYVVTGGMEGRPPEETRPDFLFSFSCQTLGEKRSIESRLTKYRNQGERMSP